MARPNSDDYTKNELANRCYEFISFVERIGIAFESWEQPTDVDRLTKLCAGELDDRISKLKAAFSVLAAEKTGWRPGESIRIPLHPRHEMNETGRQEISVTIECRNSGDGEQYVATVPRGTDSRGRSLPPLTFTIE